MKSIYEIGLLEAVYPDKNHAITRVPGGWMMSNIFGSCFVPFNDEFCGSADKQFNELKDIEK